MKLNKTTWVFIIIIAFVIYSTISEDNQSSNLDEDKAVVEIANKEEYEYEWSLTPKGIVKCNYVGKGSESANGGVRHTFEGMEYIFIPNGDRAALIKNAASACTTDWTSLAGDLDGGFIAPIDKNFNSPIGHWDVSNVTNMDRFFRNASYFNQDIGNWDVSRVESMDGLFSNAHEFNQDISNWNVQNVSMMDLMFSNAKKFNQDISGWDTKNVKYMEGMFFGTLNFNQDISVWDTSNVVTMYSMFEKASSFTQDISGWDVSKVEHARCFSYESVFAKSPQLHPKFKVDSSCEF